MRVLKNTRLEKGCVGLENRRPPLDGEPDLTISTGSHIITLMGRTLNKGHMGNVGLTLLLKDVVLVEGWGQCEVSINPMRSIEFSH